MSKWNWPPDFARMTAAGVDGLVVRASYGTTRDERLDEFVHLHKQAGTDAPPIVALYHYCHPWQGWREQLDALLAAMRQHGVRRGALDLEDMRFERSSAALEGLETLTAEEDLPPSVRRRMNERLMRGMGIDPEAWDDEELFYGRTAFGGLEATAVAVQPRLVEDARLFMEGLDAVMPLSPEAPHLIYSNWSYWSGVMGRPSWGAKYGLHLAAWTTAAKPAVPAPWTRWTLWQY